jgi:outer membrane receptor protein involved in Fe transport
MKTHAAWARALGLTLAAAALPTVLLRAQTAPPAAELPQVNIIGSTPLLGTGQDPDAVPAETDVLRAKDLSRTGPPDLTRALGEQNSGITLDNAAGNPYQPDIFYHGFQASPLQGSEQGLAVYVGGVRFNEPFGDTVNWDLLPNNAIDQVNLEGSNPAFGLNALGGALNVVLKNGFTYHGGEAEISGGSFGQVQGGLQYGVQSDNTAAYAAATAAHEAGWRDLQSSELQNFFGDLGWRNDRSEVHLSLTAANSRLNGPGTAPVELLAADPRAEFTAPNTVNNRYIQAVLSGSTQVSDTLSVQANAYYGYFQQKVLNGNAPSFGVCGAGSGLLCDEEGAVLTDRSGNPIGDYLSGGPYSQLDQQSTFTSSYGASAQVSDTGTVLGRPNTAVAGLSFDGAQTLFSASSQVGGLTALSRIFEAPGITMDQADGSIVPVRVSIDNASTGVFATDTLAVTDRLSVTLSGRFNAIETDLHDQNGTALDGRHFYDRFNPAIGVTEKVTPWLTAYAGYAEANRAPTPAELSCANAAAPCSLANFFVGDPDLKQVVARTIEVGVRGTVKPLADTTLSYSVGLFRSELADDILFVNSPVLGRAFFQNVGTTQRQGVDVGLKLTAPRWQAWAGYTYTDATFQTGFVEASGSNPAADANGDITISRGDHLPGIPLHQVKLGLSYAVTDAWTVGATATGASGAYLFGDEANLTAPLPAYFVANFNTSYQVTKHVQVFGLVQNVTNQRYYVYGTFSPTSSVFLAQAPNASNPRSYNVAAPIGGFGGVRVTF